MSIKLVAIDLDDTLLDSNLCISQKNREVLARVKAQGVNITLATGRMFRSARPYAMDLNMNIPLITYQGALVKNAVSNEVLYHRPVPIQIACEAVQEIRGLGYHYQVYFDDTLYMERLSQEGQAYAELAGVEPVIEPDLLEMVGSTEPTKIIVINDDTGTIIDVENHMKQMFGERLYVTRSKPHYLELMNLQATKGMALKAVADACGINQKEVFAIGDSFNDIDMLKWAGIGAAVANAPEEVKRVADLVICSNDDDGVAEALCKLVLKEEWKWDRKFI